MFLTKRFKDNRRREIEIAIDNLKQKKAAYERLEEELKNKYLPVRDKCIDTIVHYNLGRYSLKDVFDAAYEDGKLRLLVSNVEETYWDGEKSLRMTDTLLDETIQMDTIKDFMRYENRAFAGTRVADLILKLKNPEDYIKDKINRCTLYINMLENDLDKLNK